MKKVLKYKAVSLIEMLITMVVITTVLLLATVTLTTLIRVSSVSNGRTMARDESEFVLELLRRNIRNTDADDVYVYNVSGRTFDEEENKTVDSETVTGYESEILEGIVGNEIHFRPVGYDRWMCIGYFPSSTDDTVGYIVKSSYSNNLTPQNCLKGDDEQYIQNAMVLNSSEVYAQQLSFVVYKATEGNVLITIEVKMKPRVILLSGNKISPEFFRQALISSQKLTWE